MAFFPAHWRIFAIVWLFLAVRLWRHGQCCLASDAEQRVCKSAFQREQITGLNVHFWKPSPRLPVPLEAEPVSVRVLGRSLVTPAQDSLPDLSRSNGTSDLCAPFPRSKTRRDSTFPREVPGGPLALFSRSSLRASGTLREAHCGSSPDPLHSQELIPFTLKTTWHTNQNPEQFNSLSTCPSKRNCASKPSTSPWDSKQKSRRFRPSSISSQRRTKSILLRCSVWKRKSITRFNSSNP